MAVAQEMQFILISHQKDVVKLPFLVNAKFFILIKISLKFVLKGAIDTNLSMV